MTRLQRRYSLYGPLLGVVRVPKEEAPGKAHPGPPTDLLEGGSNPDASLAALLAYPPGVIANVTFVPGVKGRWL